MRILTSLGYIFKVFRLWSVLIFSILRINLVPWLVISKLLFSVSSIIIGQITQNNAKCRHCANRRLICVAHPHQKLFAVCWANEEMQFTVSENSTCSLKICIMYRFMVQKTLNSPTYNGEWAWGWMQPSISFFKWLYNQFIVRGYFDMSVVCLLFLTLPWQLSNFM